VPRRPSAARPAWEIEKRSVEKRKNEKGRRKGNKNEMGKR
jgi:hypothetical protein